MKIQGTIVVLSLIFATSALGKGKPQPTVYKAGTTEILPIADAAVVDDGGGIYSDADPDTDCVVDAASGFARFTSTARSITLHFGTCTSENCETPFNGAISGAGLAPHLDFRSGVNETGEWRLPYAGETIELGFNWNGFHFFVDGQEYIVAWYEGEIEGLDDDNDGVADRYVLTNDASDPVELYRKDITVTRKGKRVTTSTDTVLISEFTNMPMAIEFRPLGYTVDEVPRR